MIKHLLSPKLSVWETDSLSLFILLTMSYICPVTGVIGVTVKHKWTALEWTCKIKLHSYLRSTKNHVTADILPQPSDISHSCILGSYQIPLTSSLLFFGIVVNKVVVEDRPVGPTPGGFLRTCEPEVTHWLHRTATKRGRKALKYMVMFIQELHPCWCGRLSVVLFE